MRPWDVEEIQIEKGVGLDSEGDLWLYAGEDAPIGVVHQEAPGSAYAWAKMFQASPKMVKILRGQLRRDRRPNSGPEECHTRSCWEGIYAYLTPSGCSCNNCEDIRNILATFEALP